MSQSPEAMKVWMDSMMAYGGAEALKSATPEEAAASVIEAALQKARDEEIAAVVAWLRDPGRGRMSPKLTTDAIARGDHRSEG